MALAAQVVFTVIDDTGERGTTSVNVPVTFSIAQYVEFAAQMGTLIDAVLHGKVESAEICFGVDISGLVSNLLGGNSDVEEIGAFQFRTSDNLTVSLNVPGLDELVVGAGSDALDQGQAVVANLITAMENGLTTVGGTISPCDVAETDIVSLDYARERFRASGSKG